MIKEKRFLFISNITLSDHTPISHPLQPLPFHHTVPDHTPAPLPRPHPYTALLQATPPTHHPQTTPLSPRPLASSGAEMPFCEWRTLLQATSETSQEETMLWFSWEHRELPSHIFLIILNRFCLLFLLTHFKRTSNTFLWVWLSYNSELSPRLHDFHFYKA